MKYKKPAIQSKYKPEYGPMLVEHLARGLSYESFAGEINVTRDCLYKWEKRHPDFIHYKNLGREKMLKFYEQMGIALATGKLQGNVTAWIFLCKNKIGYTDKTEITGNVDKPLQLKYSLDRDPDSVKPNPRTDMDEQSGEEN